MSEEINLGWEGIPDMKRFIEVLHTGGTRVVFLTQTSATVLVGQLKKHSR